MCQCAVKHAIHSCFAGSSCFFSGGASGRVVWLERPFWFGAQSRFDLSVLSFGSGTRPLQQPRVCLGKGADTFPHLPICSAIHRCGLPDISTRPARSFQIKLARKTQRGGERPPSARMSNSYPASLFTLIGCRRISASIVVIPDLGTWGDRGPSSVSGFLG